MVTLWFNGQASKLVDQCGADVSYTRSIDSWMARSVARAVQSRYSAIQSSASSPSRSQSIPNTQSGTVTPPKFLDQRPPPGRAFLLNQRDFDEIPDRGLIIDGPTQ